MEHVIQRLIRLPIVVLGVSFLVFMSLRLIPGDPALTIAGQEASAEEVQRVREVLGLDKPIPIQFSIWLSEIIKGDFGESLITGKELLPFLAPRFKATLTLATTSAALATILGLSAGLLAALRPYSKFDNLITILSLVGVSVPSFWLGIILIIVFAVQLGWFPAGGSGSWKHVILPSLSLASFSMGTIARMTRASMLEVMQQDYIQTARSKGLRERIVYLRHTLKNALVPILTVIGLQFGYLLAGSVVTETVFTWPGIGRLLLLSLLSRDYTLVQGAVLIIATCFVLVNMLVDMCYPIIDPRIQL